MPTIIRQRRMRAREYDHSAYEELRLREVKQERCPTCTERWASSMMKTEPDGIRRCPDCRLSPRTEPEKAAIDQHDAERIGQKQTKPQISQMPLRDSSPPWIRVMEDAGGVRLLQSAPLVLVRSGPTKQLLLRGGGFSASDTFTFSTGISASSSTLTGTTLWTLTLSASGAASPGLNHMTYNGHTYRNIFNVG